VTVVGFLNSRAYNHALSLSSQVEVGGRTDTQSQRVRAMEQNRSSAPKAAAPAPKAVVPAPKTADAASGEWNSDAEKQAICSAVRLYGAKYVATKVVNETVAQMYDGNVKLSESTADRRLI